jgi:hypothetical protein
MAAWYAGSHPGGVDAHDPYLSLLVATDAALLMILALLAKKQLERKRPALQPISRRGRDPVEHLSFRQWPAWMKGVLLVGVCVGGAVAGGAGVSGAVAPAAAVAYLAAAVFLLLTIR